MSSIKSREIKLTYYLRNGKYNRTIVLFCQGKYFKSKLRHYPERIIIDKRGDRCDYTDSFKQSCYSIMNPYEVMYGDHKPRVSEKSAGFCVSTGLDDDNTAKFNVGSAP